MLLQRELSEVQQSRIKWFNDPLECTKGVQGIVILTEWDEFKDYDYRQMYEAMEKPAYLFDFRRILNTEQMKTIGFNFIQLGVNNDLD